MEKTAYRLDDILAAMMAIQIMSTSDFCLWFGHLQYELKLQASASKRDSAFEAYNQCRESWRIDFDQSEESRYYNRAIELLKEWFRHDHAFRRLEAHFQKEDHEEFKRQCEVLKDQADQPIAVHIWPWR